MAMQGEPAVHPSNTAQSAAWNGDEGAYWAERADRFDDAVADYQRPLLDAAAITPTSRVLDIGCGAGRTALDAARIAVRGSVLGVDLSAALIATARRAAEREGLPHARFVQTDAQVHPFDAGVFDVALSRAGAMFFGDPVAAFTNIAAALRPGGRLVLLVWQPMERNAWIVAIRAALAAGRDLPAPPPDAPGPFSLGDPERILAILTAAGFTDVRTASVCRPLVLGRDPADAHGFLMGMLGWMLDGLDEHGRAEASGALLETLRAHTTGGRVALGSAAWLVTATHP